MRSHNSEIAQCCRCKLQRSSYFRLVLHLFAVIISCYYYVEFFIRQYSVESQKYIGVVTLSNHRRRDSAATATSVSYRKIETLSSCIIEIAQQIVTKFVTVDYVRESTST